MIQVKLEPADRVPGPTLEAAGSYMTLVVLPAQPELPPPSVATIL